MQNGLESQVGDRDQENVLESETTASLWTRCRSAASLLQRNSLFLLKILLDDKDTTLLAPQTLANRKPETVLNAKKGGKKPKQVVNFSSPSRGEVFSL